MSSSAFQDPNIIDGPRKRRPTDRLLENGDPLSHKKTKTTSTTSTSSVINRWASVEDFEEPASASRSHPHDPTRILEASDGSDDAINIPESDMPGLAPTEDSSNESTNEDSDDDEDDNEPELVDDITELGMCSISVQDQRTNIFARKTSEGLECADLCIFQAHSHYPVCRRTQGSRFRVRCQLLSLQNQICPSFPGHQGCQIN